MPERHSRVCECTACEARDDDHDRFDRIDEAELRGHVRIHCRQCGYRGMSDDTGNCPRCEPEPKEESGSESDDS